MSEPIYITQSNVIRGLINADANGAYNIMRKGKQNFSKEGLSSGFLESPIRITIQ